MSRTAAALRRACALGPTALAEAFSRLFEIGEPRSAKGRRRLYPLHVTLFLLLSQCLSIAVSCREAVLLLRASRAAAGLPLPGTGTAAYCRARKRLPPAWLESILAAQAAALVNGVPERWRWCGHDVKVVDGTTLRLADTPANQERWPQPASQKPGCGFPSLRIVTVFSLATGALLAKAAGGLAEGEGALLRSLQGTFAKGDVVLRDRGFADYATAAALLAAGVHSVVRIHQRLSASIAEVSRTAEGDRIVRWCRPKKPTGGATAEQWSALPETIDVRLVDVTVDIAGFRTRAYTILTTLTDAARYSREDLAELYRRRWEVELDLRDLKTTMGFAELRARSPEMALREIDGALIAYNFVRALMAEAAGPQGPRPRALSFAAAIQALRQFLPAARHLRKRLFDALLKTIRLGALRTRSGRTEPRAVKRRGTGYALLNKPRKDFVDIPHRSRHSAKKNLPKGSDNASGTHTPKAGSELM
jgi:hypothetical protein